MVNVLCYKSEGLWFNSRWCHWNFSVTSHNGPGVDSASNRNEYQENFPGGKCEQCVRLTTLPPPCAVVMKVGNLNCLEPSGLLQACNGTALLFPAKLCVHFNMRYEINVKFAEEKGKMCYKRGSSTAGTFETSLNI